MLLWEENTIFKTKEYEPAAVSTARDLTADTFQYSWLLGEHLE
jgi:hypothetical protein